MIILRPFQPEDWPVLSQYQYPSMPEEEAKKLIVEFNSGIYNGHKMQMLAVEVHGRLAGYVSLMEQNENIASEGVEIYPPYRRQGLAFAAITQLLEMPCNYHIINAQIRKDNTASLGLHQKLGFRIVDEFVNRRGNPVYMLEKVL